MPGKGLKAATRRDDLLLVNDAVAESDGGRRVNLRPPPLQNLINGMCSLMLGPDAPLMPKRLAGKVFEKLIRPGRFSVEELPAQPDQMGFFHAGLQNLSRQSDLFDNLAANLRALSPRLQWAKNGTGPFASRGFERAHAHAVIVGPTGVEQRTDVRIGITALAPYTRFPDHTQFQPRSFLALSALEFCTEQESWREMKIGDVCYGGGNEIVAMRCTANPFLMLWCNVERRQ